DHGVGIFLELHHVWHAADHPAICSLAERRLVDRTVGRGEAIVGPVEFPAGFLSVMFRPTFVLGLEDEAGSVPKNNQAREPSACHGAIGIQGRSSVDDGLALAVDHLIDLPIVADEEGALRLWGLLRGATCASIVRLVYVREGHGTYRPLLQSPHRSP